MLAHATPSPAGNACVQSERTKTPRSVQVDGYTAALLDAGDSLLLPGRLQLRAVERNSHGSEFLGLAEGTRLEGALFFPDVPGDVEGVALAIAEPVDDGAAVAAFLVDGLFEGLGFAPVPLQVFALSDVQRLLTGLQHLLSRHRAAFASFSMPGARLLLRLHLLGIIGLVFVRRRDSTLRAAIPLSPFCCR